MDKKILKEKMESKDFDYVVSFSLDLNNKLAPSDVGHIILILLVNNRSEDAKKIFSIRRSEIEKENFILSMEISFDIACFLEDEILLNEEKNYYLNSPYISQEVEEILNSIDKKIEERRRYIKAIKGDNKSKDLTIAETQSLLESNDEGEVLLGIIKALKLYNEGIDLTRFVLNICQKSNKYVLKNYYLYVFLIMNHVEGEFEVTKFNKKIHFKLSDYFDNFGPINEKISKRIKELRGITKNISFFDTLKMVDTYLAPYLFPEYYKDFDVDSYIFALFNICEDMYDEIIEDDPVLDVLEYDETKAAHYLALHEKYMKEKSQVKISKKRARVPKMGHEK